MSAQPRKQLLLDTAFRLFNEHGYHATGIDRILAESGVSKATLYKHYHSKDELILAVLQQRHERFEALCLRKMAEAQDHTHPALGLFDALHEWFHARDFYGCNFIKASAEYARADDAIYQYAARHKESIRRLIESNLRFADKRTRRRYSEQIALLVEGAIVCAHTHGERNAALTARSMAETLLSAAGR